MSTKQRNRVLTYAEAITQNQKTARVWLECRDNITIRARCKMGGNFWQVIPYYNLGIGSFFVYPTAYGTKWRCWEKKPTREETNREPWSEPWPWSEP